MPKPRQANLDPGPLSTLEEHFLTRNADLQFWEPGEKTVVLFAKLPGGFEIVVSAHADRASDHDPSVGREVCVRKFRDRVIEYKSANGQLYDNGTD